MSEAKNRRVGVLMGGMSTERSVSLKSGHAVADALRRRGHDVVEIDVGPDLPFRLRDEAVGVAWLALHGRFGEDGCVQGLLEIMRIPYTGSGVQGSAIAMDKIATKRLLAESGLFLPADRTWRPGDAYPEGMTFPVVVKDPHGGSTIGIQIARDPSDLERALVQLGGDDTELLLEQYVAGEEITVAVLFGRPLPVVSIRPDSGFFDFEAKYSAGHTQYLVPAPIDPVVAATAQAHAKAAYKALGLSGVARADFILDEAGVPWFLEINTLPGMTATSLSPMAAGATGMSFEDLCEALLAGACCHYEVAKDQPLAKAAAAKAATGG